MPALEGALSAAFAGAITGLSFYYKNRAKTGEEFQLKNLLSTVIIAAAIGAITGESVKEAELEGVLEGSTGALVAIILENIYKALKKKK